MEIVSKKIVQALEFAAQAHEGQYRKGKKIPYISHPASVGFILQSLGYTEDTVIAGILHDVIEDTDKSLKDIEELFGSEVGRIVLCVTETKNPIWLDKKNEYIEKVSQSDEKTKAVSAADLLDNARSLLRLLDEGIDMWSNFKTIPPEMILENYEHRLNAVKDKIPNNLSEEIQATIKNLKQKREG